MGLEMVEISMDTEDHFGISLRDNVLGEIETYGEFLDQIVAAVSLSDSSVGPAEVDTFLRQKLIEEYSIKAEQIHRGAKLYLELGLG